MDERMHLKISEALRIDISEFRRISAMTTPIKLTIAEERLGQYASKHRAIRMARLETQQTGVQHRICLTTTYRNLMPRVCWTVVLGCPGRGDGFQG